MRSGGPNDGVDGFAAGVSVLDVGCGQGTQAIRLARRGCTVVGVDPSAEQLQRAAADARSARVALQLHQGRLGELDSVLGECTFDVVCAHGLLMYLDDPLTALDGLTERLAPGGLLSVTFRNGDALAFRPGMRHQWRAAVEAMNETTYVNELGVHAVAHRRVDVNRHLVDRGLRIEEWYGVRVFTDPVASEEPVSPADWEWLLQAEQHAGRRDPYRHVAAQIHLLARRPAHQVRS